MDRSKTQGDIVSTLRWWSVAANRCQSFKQIDGQLENRKTNCFYFAIMICCCWWISVLQGHLGTGREPKEKIFLLCNDNLLLLMDLHPLRTFTDSSRTEVATDSTLGWWSVSVIRCHSQYGVQQQWNECYAWGIQISFHTQSPGMEAYGEGGYCWGVLVPVKFTIFSPSMFSHFHCNPMRKAIKAHKNLHTN